MKDAELRDMIDRLEAIVGRLIAGLEPEEDLDVSPRSLELEDSEELTTPGHEL